MMLQKIQVFNLYGNKVNTESQTPQKPTYNTTTQAPNPIDEPQCDAIA